MTNLPKTKTQTKILLHVGCSFLNKKDTTPGFQEDSWKELRLDIDPKVNPDIIGSMLDLSMIPKNKIDAIFSSHNIEHLYTHEVPIALEEFHRVLKPDGFIIITCPDLQSICELVAQDQLTQKAYFSSQGSITPLDMIFGLQSSIAKGNHFMAHKTGFTKTSMIETFEKSSFSQILCLQRPKKFDLFVLATKTEWPVQKLQAVVQEHIVFS